MLDPSIERRSNNLSQHERRRNASPGFAQMPRAYYSDLQMLVHQIDRGVELRRIVPLVNHKLRLQNITGPAVVRELCVIALRPPVARLIVECAHLAAHVPKRHRTKIRRIDALPFRVHAAHLIHVIPSHTVGGELLNERLLAARLRKAGHFIEHPTGGLEWHRSEVHCDVGHLFGHATRSFSFLAFDAQLAGLRGRVLDCSVPFVGQLVAAKTDD